MADVTVLGAMTSGDLFKAAAIAVILCTAAGLEGQELKPVPSPPLGEDRSPEVRRLIREAAAVVDSVRGHGADELGNAFGTLGARYLHAGFLDAARPALTNAVALLPEEVRWRYYLAVCHERLGETADAIRHLRRMLGQREGNLPAVLRLADLLAESGEPTEARHLYRAALQSPLGVPAARTGLGRLAMQAGDHSAAVEHFRAAAEAQPSASQLYRLLGQALRAAGRGEEARRYVGRGGEVEVRYPDPLMVQLALEMKDESISVETSGVETRRGGVEAPEWPTGEIEALHRAVEARPDDSEARRRLARALLESGDAAGAREHYGAILRFSPDDAEALLEAGSLDLKQGRREGLELLQQAVTASPQLPEPRSRLAAALVASGRLAEAVPHLEKVVELDPDDEVSHLRLGQTLLEIGRLDEARRRVTEWLERRPGHHEGLLLSGRVAVSEGDLDGAREAFARVADLDSAAPGTRASAHFNLGLLRQEAGQAERAMTAYRQALTFDPRHAQALFNLAVIEASRGELGVAIELYERLFEIEPDNHGVRYRLAVSLMRRGDMWPALGHFEALHEADPHRVDVVVSSSLLLAEVDQGENAVRRLEGALAVIEEPADRSRLFATLAELRLEAGDRPQALAAFEEAVAADGANAEARLAYARLLALGGDYAAAVEQFQAHGRLAPDDEESHFAHAMALIFSGRFAAARDLLAAVTARLPSVPLTHLLARLLASAPEASVRLGERAVEIATTVFERERTPPHGETLAMAMAAAGRFEEALTLQRRLLEEARQAEFEPGFIRRVEENLARYEQRLPGISGW